MLQYQKSATLSNHGRNKAYRDHELVAGDIASCVYEVTETAVLVAQIGHALMIEDSEMRHDRRMNAE